MYPRDHWGWPRGQGQQQRSFGHQGRPFTDTPQQRQPFQSRCYRIPSILDMPSYRPRQDLSLNTDFMQQPRQVFQQHRLRGDQGFRSEQQCWQSPTNSPLVNTGRSQTRPMGMERQGGASFRGPKNAFSPGHQRFVCNPDQRSVKSSGQQKYDSSRDQRSVQSPGQQKYMHNQDQRSVYSPGQQRYEPNRDQRSVQSPGQQRYEPNRDQRSVQSPGQQRYEPNRDQRSVPSPGQQKYEPNRDQKSGGQKHSPTFDKDRYKPNTESTLEQSTKMRKTSKQMTNPSLTNELKKPSQSDKESKTCQDVESDSKAEVCHIQVVTLSPPDRNRSSLTNELKKPSQCDKESKTCQDVESDSKVEVCHIQVVTLSPPDRNRSSPKTESGTRNDSPCEIGVQTLVKIKLVDEEISEKSTFHSSKAYKESKEPNFSLEDSLLKGTYNSSMEVVLKEARSCENTRRDITLPTAKDGVIFSSKVLVEETTNTTEITCMNDLDNEELETTSFTSGTSNHVLDELASEVANTSIASIDSDDISTAMGETLLDTNAAVDASKIKNEDKKGSRTVVEVHENMITITELRSINNDVDDVKKVKSVDDEKVGYLNEEKVKNPEEKVESAQRKVATLDKVQTENGSEKEEKESEKVIKQIRTMNISGARSRNHDGKDIRTERESQEEKEYVKDTFQLQTDSREEAMGDVTDELSVISGSAISDKAGKVGPTESETKRDSETIRDSQTKRDSETKRDSPTNRDSSPTSQQVARYNIKPVSVVLDKLESCPDKGIHRSATSALQGEANVTVGSDTLGHQSETSDEATARAVMPGELEQACEEDGVKVTATGETVEETGQARARISSEPEQVEAEDGGKVRAGPDDCVAGEMGDIVEATGDKQTVNGGAAVNIEHSSDVEMKVIDSEEGINAEKGDVLSKVKNGESMEAKKCDEVDKDITDDDEITSAYSQSNALSSKSIGEDKQPVRRGSKEMGTPDQKLAEKKRSKERHSPTSFLDFADDLDDEEESDDDMLGTAPAFLKSIEELTGRPFQASPVKSVCSSSQNSSLSDGHDISMDYHSPLDPKRRPLPHGRSKFTLDNLLADHMTNFEHEKEMDEIKCELKAGIQEGGFVNILNKEEEYAADVTLPEDKQDVLRQFLTEESHICDHRPGTPVFHNQRYQCLFDGKLRPADCGFNSAGKTHLEKHLATVVPAQYLHLLTTSVIPLLFPKLPCKAALLKWLFFLMSVEQNKQTCDGCQTVLQTILHKHHKTLKCFPDVYDLLSVLVNYGADLETLIPTGLVNLDKVRSKLHQQPQYQSPQAQGDGVEVSGYQKDNLFMVLKFLALSLYRNSVTITTDDLDLLLIVLCKASLDTSFKSTLGVDAFHNCVAMTVKQYTDDDWEIHKLKVCRLVSNLSDHHHNMASLAQLLPKSGARDMYLQRTVGYLMLDKLLNDDGGEVEEDEEVLSSVLIRDLHQFVGPMKELLINDPYKLSSIITILDICVGVNISLRSSEREELKTLIELVHGIRVRDDVSMLDRTRVKDMMVRLTSSWSLDIQTMKGKQTKIFEYAVHDSPVKMKIEAVETSQVDEDSGTDTQSDDEAKMPYKIPKLQSASEEVT